MMEIEISLLLGFMVLHIYMISGDEEPNYDRICPKSQGKLTRLGQTQFYLLMEDDLVSRGKAAIKCEEYQLQLAPIHSTNLMSIVGRELELVVLKKKLTNTRFWTNVRYDKIKESYYWQHPTREPDKKRVVKYSSFLYKHPRPLGVAGHHVNSTINGDTAANCEVRHCVALTMPWPRTYNQRSGVIYGYQTMLEEKPCTGSDRLWAICQSFDLNCNVGVRRFVQPFRLHDFSGHREYFENGIWIFGDRKYLVNWGHRTLGESKVYCESLDLEVLQPGLSEKSLIPFLKMWSRNVTVSHFWTAFTYNAPSRTFLNTAGQPVATQEVRVQFSENETLQERSYQGRSISQSDFCVAVSFMYEFKEQMDCPSGNDELCTWSFMEYVPSVCSNYHGTICQHKDRKQRSIVWKQEYTRNVKMALEETAMISFGYDGNPDTHRSTYKQSFGSLLCKPGYRMLRANNTNWFVKPDGTKNFYKYDYQESYWVIDDDFFYKDKDSECTISEPDPVTGDGFTRKLTRVGCVTWHFYLCEKITVQIQPKQYQIKIPPDPIWRSGIQARSYPILVRDGAATDTKIEASSSSPNNDPKTDEDEEESF